MADVSAEGPPRGANCAPPGGSERAQAASVGVVSPLGHATAYPDAYDASLLFAISRAPQRAQIGLRGDLPFTGADVWNAFEHTWLEPSGKPRIAIVTLTVPASSPAIVESKSVKLYLGSFAQSRFADDESVRAAIARDIGAAVAAPVGV
ncbi:MAG: hypothetical protein IT518_20510, partial [Burkholderiales bacterium]|nr:hypothetical protein [Burkholderiales bacterium]